VDNIVQQAIEDVLAPIEKYEEKLVPKWINEVCERVMSNLNKLKKPYKYVMTCAIIQRIGVGATSLVSCSWENYSDGVSQIVWPANRANKENQNKVVSCMVTVFSVQY
jgi:dynein light chain Tctex-type 1